ncbi:hypothetical protein CEP54_015049 [Fusarium duplospermum]|uniref:Thioester reductase (TE) domain-containing protein n=1 Tax=Fusarium duplospermum TaxID=1325734 RepID=A0A428NRW2_9HYPO|nr:hypothetical protein CEP54_015049 [Fusarium duplospermum]
MSQAYDDAGEGAVFVGFWVDHGRGNILGATLTLGFLGRKILRLILERNIQVTVTCIVRGRNPHHSRQRLIDTLRPTAWWNSCFQERVEVWAGDLAEPRVGLDGSKWQSVFGLGGQPRQVDVIIHNGASVNWLEPYDALRSTNVSRIYHFVEGILRSTNPPRLFYVSGGYLSGAEEANDELVEKIYRLPAYDQTKFLSEALVKRAQLIGTSASDQMLIFKSGFIIGSTGDGRTQTGDALWRMVKACIQAGSYSQDDAQKWIPVAGVDSVASMLVDQVLLTRSSSAKGRFQKVLDGIYFQKR